MHRTALSSLTWSATPWGGGRVALHLGGYRYAASSGRDDVIAFMSFETLSARADMFFTSNARMICTTP
jgi:hypothetical protein